MPGMPEETFESLISRKEPLDPELARCAGDVGLFPVVKHPLVYAVPFFPGSEALLNAQLRHRREAVALALRERNYHRYVFLHERPYRPDALKCVTPEMECDSDYWRLVRNVYQDSENVEELPGLWDELLRSERPERACLMGEDERRALTEMPEELTIWRGACDEAELNAGFSWSLSRDIAYWFACRLTENREVLVAKAVVAKQDALAYLSTRNEEEIIALPEHVRLIAVERVRARQHRRGSFPPVS